ncbi:MAG: acyltransferase [Acidobacteria bacterium]|nr:acyltransferase [Acidobacteriota bacterium]
MTGVRSKVRADIQALRGIAILLVVAYHAHAPGFDGGFVGVDVFFVLSGFLITKLLVDEQQRTGSINLMEFYARRARRLLPPAVAVTLLTVCAAELILSPLEQRRFVGSAIAVALYVSNMLFARDAENYLASPPDDNPFLHTWSLSVEEQFYALWPLMLLAAGYRARTRGKALAATMLIVMVSSFGLCIWLMNAAPSWAFFSAPSRAWEFAIGGFVALIGGSLGANASDARREWLATGGMAAILLAGVAFSSRTVFPGTAALLPVIGTAIVIAAKAGNTRMGAWLFSRPLQQLGDLSYVWYLWHWPVLVFARALAQGEIGLGPRLLCALGSLVLAAITRRVLEDRIRFSPYLMPRPALTLGLAVSVTIVSVGSYAVWREAVIAGSEDSGQQQFAEARRDLPLTIARGCLLNYPALVSPECVFGAATSQTTVVLFGDSHANHWFPALEAIAQQQEWKIVSLTKAGCPAADYTPFVANLRRPYTECDTWRRTSIARAIGLRPSLVLISNSTGFVRDEEGQGGAITRAEWAAALRRTLTEFDRSGLRTVVLHDLPAPGFDAPLCLARLAARPWTMRAGCEFSREESVRPLMVLSEQEATRGLPHVRALDMSSDICATARCGVARDGMVLYSDDDHLSATFSAALGTSLGLKLAALPWGDVAPDGGEQ